MGSTHSKGTYSKNTFNKQFKRDSARVAFSLCVDFGVEVPCSGLVIACFTP
ncbi:DUF3265 domain-containing protein [Vibrio alginolyticus]|nr:DUF3265 domain-containing protein [Vibrio alginolyticus]EHC9866291.1 DUF3265 domain-containing protein [Vibrio alginolyticus]EJS0322123.1 DUF3265 domain-containing protein [Vibrio alginolyticus]EJV5743997.1 DUF3265 domain-containing protein [Vibrio alginolyticus]ELA7834365.1 DUF3265 domain-containing protein [Vibrio alginolyticus]